MHYVVPSSVFMHEMTCYSRNNRRLWCSKTEHYLHDLRKQIKIHTLYVVMIFEKIKCSFFILHSRKSPYKGIIENQEMMKVGLSETHASENREASTHND